MKDEFINEDKDIAEGCRQVCEREPRFYSVMQACGYPALRRSDGGLSGLLEIVVEQQISIHAAAAIWGRFVEAFAPFDAELLSKASDEAMIACGLSRPKIRTMRAVSDALRAGELDFARLHDQPYEQLFETLTAIKGIGPWTAEVYLLSRIGHRDAFPGGDIALQEAARQLFGLEQRPTAKALEQMAESWRPWRSVAARLLWAHYRYLNGFDQAR